jgi:hypothetical protein
MSADDLLQIRLSEHEALLKQVQRVLPSRSAQRCCLTGEASLRIRDKRSLIQQQPLRPCLGKGMRSRPPNSAPSFGR